MSIGLKGDISIRFKSYLPPICSNLMFDKDNTVS